MSRPTAADVARLSGVSTATVSYVLNKTPGQTISESTRERVRAAADELGYVPSGVARTLAKGTSRVVIVDLSEIAYGAVFARTARELATELDVRGYLPIVDQLEHDSGSSHRRILSLAAMFAPIGVVTVTPLPAPVRAQLESQGVFHFASFLTSADGVQRHLRDAARVQAVHLHERGHRVVGYVGTAESHLVELAALRFAALRKECDRLGVHAVDVSAERDPDLIAHAVRAARLAHPGMSAIAAYNDEVALGVLSAADRLGLRVPDELAVIGVDDSPLATVAIPPLTTVGFRPLVQQSAADTIDVLFSNTPMPPEFGEAAVELVLREST